jgi:hypothetical protein
LNQIRKKGFGSFSQITWRKEIKIEKYMYELQRTYYERKRRVREAPLLTRGRFLDGFFNTTFSPRSAAPAGSLLFVILTY